MSPTILRERGPIRHLVAAGLFGFVLGAFVVASLGHMAAKTGTGAIIISWGGFGWRSRLPRTRMPIRYRRRCAKQWPSRKKSARRNNSN